MAKKKVKKKATKKKVTKKKAKKKPKLPHGYHLYDPSDQEIDAWYLQAGKWAWDLLDRSDSTHSATGIAIALGERRFLATVAHFAREVQGVDVGRGGARFAAPKGFRKVYCSGSREDVASLELTEEQAATVREFVTERYIMTDIDLSPPWPVLVTGFPTATTIPVSNRQKVHVQTNILGYTLPIKQWPEPDDLDVEPEVGRDIFLEYPPTSEGQVMSQQKAFPQASSKTVRTPAPHGLSGGGIWLAGTARMEGGEVVFPNVQLIGIQHAFLRRSQLLRGTLIEQWLDLVAANYPDLRDVISALKIERKMGRSD